MSVVDKQPKSFNGYPQVNLTHNQELGLSNIAETHVQAITRPLYWHRPAAIPGCLPIVINGTCFALRFPTLTIGLTAAHVIRAYEADRRDLRSGPVYLGSRQIPLLDRVLDCDDDLDIATFRLYGPELVAEGLKSFDCRRHWPCSAPFYRQDICVVGFPNDWVRCFDGVPPYFPPYRFFPVVQDVREREFYTTFEPGRDQGILGSPTPPVGMNMSGCSGGPVFGYFALPAGGAWLPVGLITTGPNKSGQMGSSGENLEFDIIRFARLSLVDENGRLPRPRSIGWLPRH